MVKNVKGVPKLKADITERKSKNGGDEMKTGRQNICLANYQLISEKYL